MKTGILFDLDGTLLNTLEDLRDATNYALSRFSLPPRSLEEVRAFVGNGAAQLIARAAEGYPEPERVLAVFRSYYDAHCRGKTAPYPGIPEALETLGRQYPIAIVSNKPDSAVKSLCADYFPGVFALGEQAECPRKPAPDMVYRAMAALGVESCVYVGDSEVDVLTARRAGVPCLSVLWGFRDEDRIREAGGTAFCRDPRQLPELLAAMIG